MNSHNESSGATSAVADLLVVATSAGAFLILEPIARRAGYLPGGEESSGLLSVFGILAIIIVIVLFRGPSIRELGFRRPMRWVMVPVWALGILGVYLLTLKALPIFLSPYIDIPSPDLTRYRPYYQNLPAALSLAATLPLTASIPEEFIYRGFLMNRLSRIFGAGIIGTVITVLVQGLIFGSIHFAWGPGGMVLTTIIGLIWGSAFVLCGRNLWIVIIAHSLVHLVFVAQLYFMGSLTAG